MFARISQVIIILSLALTATPLLAASFFIEPAEVVGKRENTAAAMTELIKTTILGEKLGTLAAAADQSEFSLKPKVIQIGDAAILHLDKVQKGSVVFSQSEKVETMEDLDVIVKRLVFAVINEKNADKQVEVGEITSSEQFNAMTRRKTTQHFFVGFGPAMASGMGDAGAMTNWHLGMGWQMEDNMLKVYFDTVSSSNSDNADMTGIGISNTYFFSRKDTSPLIHTGLTWGGVELYNKEKAATNTPEDEYDDDYDKDSTNGFILSAGPGMMFYRTSSVNLETSLFANVLLDTAAKGVPATYGARVTVYW